jgi:elongation factor 2
LAIKEKVKIVLFIDNVNQLLFYRKLPAKDIYQVLLGIITDLNETIMQIETENGQLESNIFDSISGNVIFGSAKNEWAFTLRQFAELYREKFGIEVSFLGVKWDFR